MYPDMWKLLFVMIAGFYGLYALAVVLSLRSEILEREERAGWVEELASGGPGSTPGIG